MIIKSFGITDVGKIREKNEDRYLICKELNLFAVADGMGGHDFGEIASKIAVETLESSMREYHLGDGDGKGAERINKTNRATNLLSIGIERLKKSIEKANKNIYEFSVNKTKTSKGMGTTIVAVYIVEKNVVIAHVGDSRVYKINNNKIEQITRDHSFVEMQVEKGILTKEEAKNSTMKNVVTKALGISEYVEVEIQNRLLEESDVFLLCSDGLSDKVEDEEILKYACDFKGNFEMIGKELVELANKRGGQDNITVLIVGADKQP